jgi:hypothetical protein
MYLEGERANDVASIGIYALYGSWRYYNRADILKMLPQFFPSEAASISCQENVNNAHLSFIFSSRDLQKPGKD